MPRPQPIVGPECLFCFGPLETARTTKNPGALISPDSLARCPVCIALFMIGPGLEPYRPDDETPFQAAMTADPEVGEWVINTLQQERLREAEGIKAECLVARRWLMWRRGPRLSEDLATLDAYSSGFDDEGFTHSPESVRAHANRILADVWAAKAGAKPWRVT